MNQRPAGALEKPQTGVGEWRSNTTLAMPEIKKGINIKSNNR